MQTNLHDYTRNRGRVVVAVINRKGGVGKTGVTANLAGELAVRGWNVGAVDTDAQGGSHLALCLGGAADDGLYKALVEGAFVGEVVQPVDPKVFLRDGEIQTGAIHVLPAGLNTWRIPHKIDDAAAFAGLVDGFADTYDLDFVLIDTGPSMSLFDGAIYDAADAFLYVTEVETLALVGIRDSFAQVERRNARRLKAGRRASEVLGIVPNKVGGLKQHYDHLNGLREAFGERLIFSPLRRLKPYPRMAQKGRVVRVLDNGGAAEECARLADEFLRAVAAWIGEGEHV